MIAETEHVGVKHVYVPHIFNVCFSCSYCTCWASTMYAIQEIRSNVWFNPNQQDIALWIAVPVACTLFLTHSRNCNIKAFYVLHFNVEISPMEPADEKNEIFIEAPRIKQIPMRFRQWLRSSGWHSHNHAEWKSYWRETIDSWENYTI